MPKRANQPKIGDLVQHRTHGDLYHGLGIVLEVDDKPYGNRSRTSFVVRWFELRCSYEHSIAHLKVVA
jgi:hypothetical protein